MELTPEEKARLGFVDPAAVVGGTKVGAAAQLPPADSSPPREAAAPAVHTGRYAVQLKDNPRLVVAAEDRLAAIDEYKRRCGILTTVHSFDVGATDEPATA